MPARTAKARTRKPAPSTRAHRSRNGETFVVRESGRSKTSRKRKHAAPSEKKEVRVRKFGRDYQPLPSWKDLESKKNAKSRPEADGYDSVSTLRIALLITAIATAFTLYIGHVNATQNTLAEVHLLQTERDQLKLELSSVKGEYDRMTGPSVINQRAAELGLVPVEQYAGTVTAAPRAAHEKD